MSSLDHPMDHPARAPLWAALVALIEAISTLLVPAGPGSLPITRPLRGRIRRALREAEGRLRRLLLPDAEAHLATLAPAATVRPKRPAAPDAAHALPEQAGSRPRTVHPFRFRLHESCGNRTAAPADSPPGRASGPDTPGDPYGLEKVSARAEFARLARLVAAVGDPGPVIHRLALVLRRRAACTLPRLPWHALWRPSDTLDLTPPFYPPPGLDPPPDPPDHVP